MSKRVLDAKYLTQEGYFQAKIASDIMYNEPRHVVSVFKDYLIFDDFSEYFKRCYSRIEAIIRLPKVFEYYKQHTQTPVPSVIALADAAQVCIHKNRLRKLKLLEGPQNTT